MRDLDQDIPAPARRGSSVAFALFILVNATLFLRPAELIPAVEGKPIYELLILSCLALSLPALTQRFGRDRLREDPITVCVLGLLVAVILSHASHFHFSEAIADGLLFFKLVVYFALLVTLIDSEVRLRRFLCCIAGLTLLVCVIALLHYHGYWQLASITTSIERPDGQYDPESGQPVLVYRMCATGIFGNPNDLSRIIVIAMLICVWGFGGAGLIGRVAWLGSGVLFGYALTLTYSRGGFLALLGGVGSLLVFRYGIRKAAMIGAVAIPVLFAIFAGRQTNLDTSEGTAQQRIQLWSEGFAMLRSSPIFGIGVGAYSDQVGLAAHNSFVQCFVETGLIGGTAFTGAFLIGCYGLYRSRVQHQVRSRQLLPCVTSILVAYAVGMLSSTRSYTPTTYIVLGIAASYLQLLRGESSSSPAALWSRVSLPLFARLAAVGCLFLATTYVYVRLTANWE
jgi:O-antigen ligase